MLFDCSVTSITDYGAEIWGFSSKEAVNKIHLRAARCFLGLPKHVKKLKETMIVKQAVKQASIHT